MASSVSLKHENSFSWQLLFVFSIFFILTSPCAATRPGRVMMMKEVLPEMMPENMKHYQPRYEGLISSQLPKRDNHPRRGPSKRHN